MLQLQTLTYSTLAEKAELTPYSRIEQKLSFYKAEFAKEQVR